MAELYLDVSELIVNPLRTGIQRVERKVIENWPGSLPRPVFINRLGKFQAAAPEAYDQILSDKPGMTAVGDDAPSDPFANVDTRKAVLLNLELFFDSARSDAYVELSATGIKMAWYIHDFIPFLRPNYFHPQAALSGMPYIRALRSIGNQLSFNSVESRDDCANRILRRPEGVLSWPVFSCGSDGLNIKRQSFDSKRVNFISVGTMEPRKNTVTLLRAFEAVWDMGGDAHLVLAGKFGADDPELRSILERNQRNPRLRYLLEPSDAVLRDEISKARALVMPSEVEGFGIPPIEAVSVGVPVIMSESIPSARLISGGAMKLVRVDVSSLVSAIRSMQDDCVARELWTEASNVTLPTWKTMAAEMAEWVRSI